MVVIMALPVPQKLGVDELLKSLQRKKISIKSKLMIYNRVLKSASVKKNADAIG